MNLEWTIFLMVLLGVSSLIVGWRLGYNKRNNELTDELMNEYRQKYQQGLIEKFNIEVENRAKAIVAECFDALYDEIKQQVIEDLEKEKENESTDSN